MPSDWRTERIFLTVKAYPSFSKKYAEASCMAGITAEGKWIRLYPVYFRDLEDEQKFKKYSWIQARVKKSKDFRIESHFIETESIKIEEEITPKGGTTRRQTIWARRNGLILTHLHSAEEVFRESRDLSHDTLSLIKPQKILDLEIDETPDEEFQKQVKNLEDHTNQMSLFPTNKAEPIELIPYSFRYKYIDDNDKIHRQKIVDWEIYQLYRNCRSDTNWKDKIRQKYLQELPKKNLHFFMGTMHQHPQNWIIIGVYQPSTDALQADMFDN